MGYINEGSKKILVYYVYEVLRKYSDEEHPLSQSRIAELVLRDFNMSCDRKAVSRNILALTEGGFDIIKCDDSRKGCFLASRTFTDSEIRMLVDSVLASRYISGSHAKEIVGKLAGLNTVYFSKKVKHISLTGSWLHTNNAQVFLNIELLSEAIDSGDKVEFVYNLYGLDKVLHPRHAEKYIVDPYQIIVNNGRYYLVGNYDRHPRVTNFRIDLITDVRQLSEKAIPFDKLTEKNHQLSLSEYSRYAVNMYDGEIILAVIRIKAEHIGDVLDWFGKDVRIEEQTGGYVHVTVRAADNGVRMWALQYGRIAEIIAPQDLREKIRTDIDRIAARYNQPQAAPRGTGHGASGVGGSLQ